MRVSYDWLKTMIDIPEDPKTLSDEYIRTGTEVEAIDTVGESFDHVVTAKVLTKTPHPDSDHMYVCSVDVGDKNLDTDGNPAPLQIVCGAQNFEAGDHIVTAMIGAVLPGDVKIKKSKLRGVASMGMNCSARELGLGGDHSGIMILPKETKSVAGVLSGQWSDQSWNMKYRKLRFFFGKGIVEELLAQLRIEKVRFRPVEGEGYAFLQPGRAAEVLSGGTVLGWVGEIHPEAREAMGIDEVVVAFELDLDKLIKGAHNQENYREFSQYPAVEHDLAIVVDNSVTCEDLERRIASAGGKLLEGMRLFDVYRDPVRVGVGKKSMAFALTYRSDDHTLTSEEVEKAHQKIVTKVCKGVNGEVRG